MSTRTSTETKKKVRSSGPEPLFTTHEAAGFIQCDPSTVSKWIDRGLLLAYRTPGGHRRIRKSDLRAFMNTYQMPIPKELAA